MAKMKKGLLDVAFADIYQDNKNIRRVLTHSLTLPIYYTGFLYSIYLLSPKLFMTWINLFSPAYYWIETWWPAYHNLLEFVILREKFDNLFLYWHFYLLGAVTALISYVIFLWIVFKNLDKLNVDLASNRLFSSVGLTAIFFLSIIAVYGIIKSADGLFLDRLRWMWVHNSFAAHFLSSLVFLTIAAVFRLNTIALLVLFLGKNRKAKQLHP